MVLVDEYPSQEIAMQTTTYHLESYSAYSDMPRLHSLILLIRIFIELRNKTLPRFLTTILSGE